MAVSTTMRSDAEHGSHECVHELVGEGPILRGCIHQVSTLRETYSMRSLPRSPNDASISHVGTEDSRARILSRFACEGRD